MPTLMRANLNQSGSSIANIDFNSIYDASFPVPTSLSTTITLAPNTYTVNINRVSPTVFEINASLISGTSCATTLYFKVNLANSNYNSLDATDISRLEGYIRKGDVEVGGTWNIDGYRAYSNPNASQINSTVELTVKKATVKIADLRFANVGSSSLDMIIFYKDQTSESASVYWQPLTSGIESAHVSYFGVNWGASVKRFIDDLASSL